MRNQFHGCNARVPPERRFNVGCQTLPSGKSAYPVARGNRFYTTIGQNLPELWADFADRGLPHTHPEQNIGPGMDVGREDKGLFQKHREDMQGRSDGMQRSGFRDRLQSTNRTNFSKSGGSSKGFAQAQKVVFVGFAEWEMDGRLHSQGEMDRLMAVAAASKFPCSRPATFEEYASMNIAGSPVVNVSGRDISFVGTGSCCERGDANTLGTKKWVVPARDPFDGTATTSATFGKKCCMCVYSVARMEKQHSLSQFGLARTAASSLQDGKLRRVRSWAGIPDKTQWAAADFSGSTGEVQRTVRYDRFFW